MLAKNSFNCRVVDAFVSSFASLMVTEEPSGAVWKSSR